MKFLVVSYVSHGNRSAHVIEAEDARSARKKACKRERLVDEAWLTFKAYPFDELYDGFFV